MRLIDADAVKQFIYDNGYVYANTLDDFPTIDLVKHGRWIYDKNGMDFNLGAWLCSECGCKNNNLGMDNRINPHIFSGSNYCPNCGARMDGGDEDAER